MKPKIVDKDSKASPEEYQEGWSNDITTRTCRKSHYYKDGVSLCGYWYQINSHRIFDKRKGDIYCEDCGVCVKKQKELTEKKLDHGN